MRICHHGYDAENTCPHCSPKQLNRQMDYKAEKIASLEAEIESLRQQLAEKASGEPVGYFISCDDAEKPNGIFYGFRQELENAKGLADALNKFPNVKISNAYTAPPSVEVLLEALRYYVDAECKEETCGGGYYSFRDDGKVARDALNVYSSKAIKKEG